MDLSTALPNLDDEGTLVDYVEEIKDAEPVVTTHSVTQNLTHVTSDFAGTTVDDGEALSVTLTADSGYTIGTPTVSMGGVDVTSTAWDSGTGKVEIASVTGDVIITASATD